MNEWELLKKEIVNLKDDLGELRANVYEDMAIKIAELRDNKTERLACIDEALATQHEVINELKEQVKVLESSPLCHWDFTHDIDVNREVLREHIRWHMDKPDFISIIDQLSKLDGEKSVEVLRQHPVVDQQIKAGERFDSVTDSIPWKDCTNCKHNFPSSDACMKCTGVDKWEPKEPTDDYVVDVKSIVKTLTNDRYVVVKREDLQFLFGGFAYDNYEMGGDFDILKRYNTIEKKYLGEEKE